jgi:hypothetical protein
MNPSNSGNHGNSGPDYFSDYLLDLFIILVDGIVKKCFGGWDEKKAFCFLGGNGCIFSFGIFDTGVFQR